MWHGQRYKQKRNFWPLEEHECKLVQVNTATEYRGRALGSQVIRYASSEMSKLGFTRIYARIWHSHKASINTFEKAHWMRIARVFEVHPLSLPITWRFKRNLRPFNPRLIDRKINDPKPALPPDLPVDVTRNSAYAQDRS